MKKLKRITTVFVVCAGLLINMPTMAQSDPNSTTANTGSNNDHDNNNWGLLGLLGLIGLAGLRKKDDRRTGNYSSTGTTR